MAKKEVSPLAIFRDLCVKLSRVFKDVYIVRNKYCIGGKVSDEEALGEILCILEPKFSDAILNLLGENKVSYFFIPDIKEAKEKIDEGIEFLDLPFSWVVDTKTIEELQKKITMFDSSFNKEGIIWENLGEKEDLIKAIYVDRQIFNLPIEVQNGEPKEYITIAKQMIPIVTEKTINGAFLHLHKDEEYENLFIIYIDFQFTHFRFHAIYHAIPTPFE